MAFFGIPVAAVQAQTAELHRSVPGPFKVVPLAEGAGPQDRESDHATVAVNRRRDIAVAFHSSRRDISGAGNMKQVEVALYGWRGDEEWRHLGTVVLGDIRHDPLGLGPDYVKCERPDVIAVDNRFFVVWTRRYQGTGFDREPAVLECAWIEIDAQGNVTILNESLPAGLGVPLDAHGAQSGQHKFWVRDCGGVADAVALKEQPGDGGPEVAVIYPHQTVFPVGTRGSRRFEQRIVTCTLNPQGRVVRGPINRLHEEVRFDGPVAPDDNAVPGLILPDATASPGQDAFWLAFEWQTMEYGFENGRVQVEYWQRNAGSWERQDSVGFRSAPAPDFKPRLRRRPNLASLPVPWQRPQAILAFNRLNPYPGLGGDGSANVVLNKLVFENGEIVASPGLGDLWPNDSQFDDGKPVPLVSRAGSGLPTCFAGRSLSFTLDRDIINEHEMAMDTGNHAMVGRPAVSYRYHPESLRPDYVVMTLEKRLQAGAPLRVWVGVH